MSVLRARIVRLERICSRVLLARAEAATQNAVEVSEDIDSAKLEAVTEADTLLPVSFIRLMTRPDGQAPSASPVNAHSEAVDSPPPTTVDLPVPLAERARAAIFRRAANEVTNRGSPPSNEQTEVC